MASRWRPRLYQRSRSFGNCINPSRSIVTASSLRPRCSSGTDAYCRMLSVALIGNARLLGPSLPMAYEQKSEVCVGNQGARVLTDDLTVNCDCLLRFPRVHQELPLLM
eukprot:1191801-Prorocentrum_minimum.AAC.3